MEMGITAMIVVMRGWYIDYVNLIDLFGAGLAGFESGSESFGWFEGVFWNDSA
jgi:hypothetical protein